MMYYLGPSPIFHHHKFQWIFCITCGMNDCIKDEIKGNDFYDVQNYNVTGCPTICIDAKMLIALKHLGSGCTTNVWIDYVVQMGQSTRCLHVETFCKSIAESTTLWVIPAAILKSRWIVSLRTP